MHASLAVCAATPVCPGPVWRLVQRTALPLTPPDIDAEFEALTRGELGIDNDDDND